MQTKFTLPNLPYAYDALVPYISAEIMQLHHQKHHQTYVDKLNDALEQYPSGSGHSIEYLLRHSDAAPTGVRKALRDNGGGRYNHSLFWQCMTPQSTGEPKGTLRQALEQRYGSFDAFREAFSQAATKVFGSGWVWLQPDLTVTTTPNQDNSLMTGGDEPLMGLDIWEHAYYLDYQNRRPEYVAAWWRVVNWEFVEDRYASLPGNDNS
jgi:Fe-Mn family superoxide dismutase